MKTAFLAICTLLSAAIMVAGCIRSGSATRNYRESACQRAADYSNAIERCMNTPRCLVSVKDHMERAGWQRACGEPSER